jgi:hypothetical protein
MARYLFFFILFFSLSTPVSAWSTYYSYYSPPFYSYRGMPCQSPPIYFSPAAPAQPTPTTQEPPQAAPVKRAPTINASHFLSGDHQAKKVSTKATCQVGFWNVTGRDVQLTVNGQSRLLPKDRALTMELNRDFAWQVDQGRAQNERVPNTQATFEVVIRP